MSKFEIGDAVVLFNSTKVYHKCMGTVVAIEGERYRIGGVWESFAPILVPEEDLIYVCLKEELARAFSGKCKDRDDILVPKIKNVILNDPAVIVIWEDGTKTVVKAQGEEFDPEKGLAMAISKKALGNKHSYYGAFLKNIPGLKKKGAK